MNNLYVLVGLPASGKSTWAMEQCNKNQNIVWLSSDKLREELYNNVNDMEHNNKIFEEMKRRAKNSLNKGFDVIYDATNINSKRRKALLDQFIGIQKICVYFAEDLDEVYCRNIARRRVVPEEVLNKMYKSLQVPMWHEGWDDIYVIRDESRSKDFVVNIKYYMDNMNQFNYDMILDGREEFKDNLNLGQDNPYHTLSVSRHMYYTYKYLKDTIEDENLLIAGLLHDIGKAYCKQFKDDNRYANFIGHENVSGSTCI